MKFIIFPVKIFFNFSKQALLDAIIIYFHIDFTTEIFVDENLFDNEVKKSVAVEFMVDARNFFLVLVFETYFVEALETFIEIKLSEVVDDGDVVNVVTTGAEETVAVGCIDEFLRVV